MKQAEKWAGASLPWPRPPKEAAQKAGQTRQYVWAAGTRRYLIDSQSLSRVVARRRRGLFPKPMAPPSISSIHTYPSIDRMTMARALIQIHTPIESQHTFTGRGGWRGSFGARRLESHRIIRGVHTTRTHVISIEQSRRVNYNSQPTTSSSSSSSSSSKRPPGQGPLSWHPHPRCSTRGVESLRGTAAAATADAGERPVPW